MSRPDERNGGMPARRAVVRWAWRMFRREWRQQVVLLALLTVAVGAAVAGAAAAYNTAGASDAATFGTADHLVSWDEPDPAALRADVAEAGRRFAATALVTQWARQVPGSTEEVEYRAFDPHAAALAPTVALLDGRYPQGRGEVAVTDHVATLFDLGIGDVFDLDGTDREVAGLVENPSDLHREFALVDPAAGAATAGEAPDLATLLVVGSDDADMAAYASGVDGATVGERDVHLGRTAVASVLGVAGVVMVLVGLLATAGFAVVAHRRLRQLGMLAATGATERHLRLVMVAHGAVLGCVAAVVGAAGGLATWFAVASGMEDAVGHRIDPLHLPGPAIVLAMALAPVASTAAAWWPARAVARVPVTLALSGRPPVPRPVHRSAALAIGLLAVGVACLARSDGSRAGLVLAGTVATIVGTLLVSPMAVRLFGVAARRLPVGPRLALRDLARHQARSASAVAATAIAVGIPAAVLVTAQVAENRPDEGNVAADQLLVWTRADGDPEGYSPFYSEDPNDSGFAPFPPDLTATEIGERERQVDRLATRLDGATVTALDVAVDPDLEPGEYGKASVTLAEATDLNGGGYLDVALLYVATPELLAPYGVDLADVSPGTEVLTVQRGDVAFANILNPESRDFRPLPVERPQMLEAGHSSLPGSFVTPDGLRAHGWESTRIGWLVEGDGAFTDEQLAMARELAVDADLLIEPRTDQADLGELRTAATVAGIALALVVLAMTVGLMRAESGRDLRTLTAAGAPSGTRRWLTSATAGGLAVPGVGLGIAGAYLGLGAGHLDELSVLVPVPVVQLLAVAVGVPVVAATAGWLAAGREPRGLARRPTD